MKTDLKTIDAMILSISKRGKILRNDGHECLVAICEHHKEHGDYTRLPKLLDAVKNSLGSSLSAAMIDWVERFYTGLKFDRDNGKSEMGFFVNVPKVKKEFVNITAEMKVKFKSSDTEAFYVGSAEGFPFYELEREVAQKPFDLKAAIVQLIRRAETAIEKNVTDHAENKVNHAQVEVLKGLVKNLDEIKDEEPAITETNVTEMVQAKKPRRSSKKAEPVADAA